MSDMCRHQREKLLGIPQTGACYVCCPWMFPNSSGRARAAYEQWHVENGTQARARFTTAGDYGKLGRQSEYETGRRRANVPALATER